MPGPTRARSAGSSTSASKTRSKTPGTHLRGAAIAAGQTTVFISVAQDYTLTEYRDADLDPMACVEVSGS
jgi:hypothetical protein